VGGHQGAGAFLRLRSAEAAGGKGEAQETLLSGIAPTLPALLRAYHIGVRAASVGFDWTQATDVVAKIEEEVAEIREAVGRADRTDQDQVEEEVGDLLFAIANLARKLGVEAETALRKRTTSSRSDLRDGTRDRRRRRVMNAMTLEELENEWQRVK
jgi:uncharacterized protein YabN with tetrapyrrole methylase and pyrophosphatase domain